MPPHSATANVGAGELWSIDPAAYEHVQVTLRTASPEAAAQARSARNHIPLTQHGDIAIIRVDGVLTRHRGIVQELLGGHACDEIELAVKAATERAGIEGILLFVRSPGGSIEGVADVADAVFKARSSKPVFAFIQDRGLSAAFWIAAQAQRITVNSTGLVGSIGTYVVVVDSSAAAEREGYAVHVVRAGAYKGLGLPGTRFAADHARHLQEVVDGINAQFLQAVTRGRGLAGQQLTAVADGRAHVAAAGRGLGLVDAIGGFDEAMNALRAAIGAKARGGGVVGAGNAAPAADAVAQVTARVNELTAGGMPRSAAHGQVFRADPALHRAWLQAMNPGKRIA